MDGSAYNLFHEGRFVALRWRAPNPTAVGEALATVESIHDQEGPLFFCPIIGPDCPTPDGPTREALAADYDVIHDCSQCVRLVVLGASVRQAFMRGVITTLTVATGLRGQGFVVDKSIRETARVAELTLGIDGEALLAKLLAAGVVSREELELGPESLSPD